MKPALLVIDVQNNCFTPASTQSLNSAIQHINAAIAYFREQQYPIYCIQQLTPEDNQVPGEPGFDIPDHLAILPSDEHIHKRYENSFNKTPLFEKLEAQDVDTVIVTGFCAEYCVLSTYRGAQDLDLKPVLLHDAIASDTLDHIRFVENISDVISLDGLKSAVEQRELAP